jgi:hypothetical protein
MNALAEVFAMNIQVAQIKDVLTTDLHTEQGIADERRNFLYWLDDKITSGERFESQVVAWDMYRLYIDFSEMEEEELELSWMLDLETALENQISPANYNEFGGQQ